MKEAKEVKGTERTEPFTSIASEIINKEMVDEAKNQTAKEESKAE